MPSRVNFGLFGLIVLALIGGRAHSAHADYAVSGTISGPEGATEAGVPVTFLHQETKVAVTVLSDAAGKYTIELGTEGPYQAMAGGRSSRAMPVLIDLQDKTANTLDFSVSLVEDPLVDLPSANWMDMLPAGDMRREFLVNCTSCHEISHPRVTKDGHIRDKAKWADAIALMRSIDEYGLTPPDFDDGQYATWLATHLTPETIAKAAPLEPASADALAARFTEYPVPAESSLPHDLVVGPQGRIWVTAFFNDEIWALSPDTGAIEAFPINEDPDTLAQVRALEFDPNGRLKILLGGTSAVVDFDPETGAYQTFDAGMYGHSLALDRQGNIWFNDYFGKPERLGRIDGKTGDLSVHTMPSANLTEAEGLPLPYGLQIDQDDILWNTSLASNQLVRFDTRTGRSKSFEMPTANSGPRRPALGPDGVLWIPEWSTGKLAKFDPKTEEFTEYQPSLATIGPYDVEVNQKTGEVWMAGSLSSSIFRFDPKTEKWTEFRWPTEPAYVRHIAVDEATGDVWSAYSSLPQAIAKIVRLQPNG
jgi:virginiamycin B lyase